MSSGGSGSQPPGWYDDGSGTVRWWDGVRWTQATQAESTPHHQPHPAPHDPSAPTPSHGSAPEGPYQPGFDPSVAQGRPEQAQPAPEPHRPMTADHGAAYGQPPQQAMYGPPTQSGLYGPSGRSPKNKVPLVLAIVGGVVVAAGGGVLLWLLAFRGDGGPETVADDWLYVQSCDEAAQYLTGQALEDNRSAQSEPEALCDFSDFSYSETEISTVAESENAATVEISLVQHYSGSEPDVPNDEHGTVTLELVTESDDWLISEILWCFDSFENEECQ